jgi:hypothetical protein
MAYRQTFNLEDLLRSILLDECIQNPRSKRQQNRSILSETLHNSKSLASDPFAQYPDPTNPYPTNLLDEVIFLLNELPGMSSFPNENSRRMSNNTQPTRSETPMLFGNPYFGREYKQIPDFRFSGPFGRQFYNTNTPSTSRNDQKSFGNTRSLLERVQQTPDVKFSNRSNQSYPTNGTSATSRNAPLDIFSSSPANNSTYQAPIRGEYKAPPVIGENNGLGVSILDESLSSVTGYNTKYISKPVAYGVREYAFTTFVSEQEKMSIVADIKKIYGFDTVLIETTIENGVFVPSSDDERIHAIYKSIECGELCKKKIDEQYNSVEKAKEDFEQKVYEYIAMQLDTVVEMIEDIKKGITDKQMNKIVICKKIVPICKTFANVTESINCVDLGEIVTEYVSLLPQQTDEIVQHLKELKDVLLSYIRKTINIGDVDAHTAYRAYTQSDTISVEKVTVDDIRKQVDELEEMKACDRNDFSTDSSEQSHYSFDENDTESVTESESD